MKKKNSRPPLENRLNPTGTSADNNEPDVRAQLGQELRKILIQKRLKQRELAALLNIQQPEVSHLFNGHFQRFTIDKLIQFFNRLGWVVTFTVHLRDGNST